MAEASYRETQRDAVLKAAGLVLEQEGLPAVQARRIAREAGCSVGTVYNLFGDIDGLLIAVNAETLDRLGRAVREAADGTTRLPLEQRLSRLALAYMRFALANRRRWEAVFKHRMPEGRTVPASYAEDQERLLAVIGDAIADVVPDPERRAATARALFGAVHGIVALALDDRLGGRLAQELEEQVLRITELASAGLASLEARRGKT